MVYSRHNPGKYTHDTWQSGSEVGKGRKYLACTFQITLVGSWNMIHQNSLEEQEAVAAESREPVVFLQWLHLPAICPGLLWSHWLSGTSGDRNLDTVDPRSYKEPSVKTHRCLQNNIVENRKVSPKKIGQDPKSICLYRWSQVLCSLMVWVQDKGTKKWGKSSTKEFLLPPPSHPCGRGTRYCGLLSTLCFPPLLSPPLLLSMLFIAHLCTYALYRRQ